MVQTPNMRSITTLVERELDGAVNSQVDLLTEASEHIIRAGGKRIRPQIVLLAYAAVGGQDISCAIPLAAAVELIHTASLTHDDINDCSDLTRATDGQCPLGKYHRSAYR